MATPFLTAEQIESEDFFSLIGMETISDQDKEEILHSMSETVHARVYSLIYESLSDAERAQFYDLSGEELIAFIQEKGFDVAEMVMEEAIKYKTELAVMFNLATHPAQTQTA